MRMLQRIIWIGLTFGIAGCAGLMDVPKTILGSTTRVLEEARINAITKTYEKGYWDCFKAALSVVEKKKYVLFQKDEVRGFMVIMGIPGSVDTTEVGVFFVELNDHQTRIELSSLSTNAKRVLSKHLFHGIDVVFGLAAADKEDGFTAEEFQNGLTPEALVKAIENDGFSVPSKSTDIDSLNALLVDAKFYEIWVFKHKDMVLPKDVSDLIAIKNRNVDEIRLLNRLLLQETYSTVCPKIKEETVK